MFHDHSPTTLLRTETDGFIPRLLVRSIVRTLPPTVTVNVKRPLTMQRLCHSPLLRGLAFATFLYGAAHAADAPPANDYPTHARVEYVNECVAKHGSKLSAIYQCSCAIDSIAKKLTYDEFVEASTFVKYATLPGEGGAIFRDSEKAKSAAKRYRDLESNALRSCGLNETKS
ncbi:MAG TPA: hypothetical protein VIL28_04075 [Steroidobacteraceae bacterium]